MLLIAIIAITLLEHYRRSFFEAISYFSQTCNIPPSWGKTFVVFIPKEENPLFVSDFRPISLSAMSVTKLFQKFWPIILKE